MRCRFDAISPHRAVPTALEVRIRAELVVDRRILDHDELGGVLHVLQDGRGGRTIGSAQAYLELVAIVRLEDRAEDPGAERDQLMIRISQFFMARYLGRVRILPNRKRRC